MSSVKLQKTVDFIRRKVSIRPQVGVILGSGLGVLAAEVKNQQRLHYSELPHFPVSTVEGHEGQFIFGELSGKNVALMQGRFHFYEGYAMEQVVFPVRVMQKLGVRVLLVTNASGGINRDFSSGDLMLITDHLNLMGTNPLIGPNYDDIGPRFPDMSEAYDRELIRIAEEVARKNGLACRKGVYAGLTGPSYETPAEIRYLRTIGADAVGMSTVPEVIVANHAGIRVLGISCVTNMAAGVLPQRLSHAEVMETANRVRDQFITLVKGVLDEVNPE
ncbi:purine-nucleoside phosphorylase [Phosphitispora fastidiosa]|uniref:purine-nucleoside phosphorylase n=1 Tax=Phosphitispora fastidiosa TaxID=2837202 RepID=UPI001E51D4EB|nr:purine-nucleoside phosphorylase [Phosphitispora fastidiosa]MBU7007705.1 purine-nucleoside phosphorylase [Phosphitispora fastidiosa]